MDAYLNSDEFRWKITPMFNIFKSLYKPLKFFFSSNDKTKPESHCIMKDLVIFNMVKMIIWPSVTIKFPEGVVIFYETEVWLSVPENPQEWENLGHASHFYLVDKVIIDSRLLGAWNCPWQISELYQMLGTVFGKVVDSFLWVVCHSSASGK